MYRLKIVLLLPLLENGDTTSENYLKHEREQTSKDVLFYLQNKDMYTFKK